MSEDTCAILPCPICGQQLRVPTDRGNLQLTCPKCRHRWDWVVPPPSEEAEKWYSLAIRHGEEGRYSDAVNAMNRAISITPKTEWSMLAGQFALLDRDRTAVLRTAQRPTDARSAGTPFDQAQPCELRELLFRCSQTGGRFRVVFGRLQPSYKFRILKVIDEIKDPHEEDSSTTTHSILTPLLRFLGTARGKTQKRARVATKVHSFDAATFDFAGWYCPCCGHSQAACAETQFVRCSTCSECVCGGRIIQIADGIKTFACHDGCKGSGRISDDYITSFDGNSLEPADHVLPSSDGGHIAGHQVESGTPALTSGREGLALRNDANLADARKLGPEKTQPQKPESKPGNSG